MIASVLLFAILFGWIAIRRMLGNMIVELTPPSDPNAELIAEMGHGMAPLDPMSMWLKAYVKKNNFSSENTDSAVALFEETVRLSPHDFRWWIELGRAYEQAGKSPEAELALKRAIELAPNYTFPHWQIGNFYLRQGKTPEAFSELKNATERNQTYREQVFSLAWNYFDQDTAKVEMLAADQPDVHASLALFYAAHGRAADSLRMWNLLTIEEKLEYPQILKLMAQGLMERRYFPQALEFAKQLGMDADAQPEVVTNGGFEKPIAGANDTRFGWQVLRNDGKFDATVDSSVRHDGARSLKLTFRSYNKPELYNVVQNVVVEPGGSYRLRFWLRTENLKSAGPPLLQIFNGNNDQLIAATSAFTAGGNDWQEIRVDFTVPASCNGISIRTARAYCGENCPIIGTMWYDDFVLNRR